jgi:hypothetical protein
VHTSFDRHEEEIIRLISARAATSRERKAYEEAHKRTETPNRKRRSQKRHGH